MRTDTHISGDESLTVPVVDPEGLLELLLHLLLVVLYHEPGRDLANHASQYLASSFFLVFINSLSSALMSRSI